ncbi:MAG: DnaB 2 protein [Chloroflexota bacterium]|nr:DnaB 2 protein [Chloroflexota bacterium]
MSDPMQGFPGFPAGKLAVTPVPNLFFSDLLPLVDNLAELKVTLHLFWLIGRKTGALRYARLDELVSDERLLAGLAASPLAGEALLRAALERAIARGALLHVTVQRAGATEEWYMVNSANGREALAKLRAGELDVLADGAEDIQLQVERPPIFVLYEQNIGLLTPMIANELRDAERHYPADWIADAFREAVTMNKRNWKYVAAILERWRAQGKDAGRAKTVIPTDAEARKRYYVPEGYEDLIEH